MAEVLRARSLSRRFGAVAAVDALDLGLEEGASLGVVGPNGAGKSTLIALLSGFLEPDEGSVLLRGRDVTRLAPERRVALGLARAFQHARSMPRLTVAEHVELALLPAGLPAARRRDLARAQLAGFGLETQAERSAADLGAGASKLLDLARATVQRPAVLLLDEPFAGLSPAEEAPVRDTIQRLQAEGTALLVVEHRLPQLLALVTDVAVLAAGRLLARGGPDVLTQDRVLEVYFGAGHG